MISKKDFENEVKNYPYGTADILERMGWRVDTPAFTKVTRVVLK